MTDKESANALSGNMKQRMREVVDLDGKVQTHPFQRFLAQREDENTPINQLNEDIKVLSESEDDRSLQSEYSVHTVSTLGPSASVLENTVNVGDEVKCGGNGIEWTVSAPTVDVLSRLDLQID